MLLPSGGLAGVRGYVAATAWWDQDGAGPLPGVLVAGGRFDLAGTTRVHNLATWDPSTSTWSDLGGGVLGQVDTLEVLPTGELVVGGEFVQAGALITDGVARWNGSAWSAFGSGIQGRVRDLVVLPNGDLCAGGQFTVANGHPCLGLARWTGSDWVPIGGSPDDAVLALAVMANGDLVIGGNFTEVGFVPMPRLARWNGTSWAAVGGGVDAVVNALAVINGTAIAVGGQFQFAGTTPASRVAVWTGSSWVALGSGVAGTVSSLSLASNGSLRIGGTFQQAGGAPAGGIAAWDGQNLTPFGPATPTSVATMTELPNGELIAGGGSESMFACGANGIARWNGANWSPLSSGTNGSILTGLMLRQGEVVVGGSFARLAGVAANNIARRNGSSWAPLGLGTDDAVLAIAERSNGDLVVGGAFTQAGGLNASHVARWNGTTWQAMGSGIAGLVVDLLDTPTTGLVAAAGLSSGGQPVHGVLQWNGTSWQPLGSGVLLPQDLAQLPNGDVLVAAYGSPQLRRWTGAAWSSFLQPAPMPIERVHVAASGRLFVAGTVTFFGYPLAIVAEWNGVVWSVLPPLPGQVRCLVEQADHTLLVGLEANGPTSNPGSLQRWNGAAWQGVGAPLGGSDGPNTARVLLERIDGTLFVGGRFDRVGTAASVAFAELQPLCPASVTATVPGCNGSAGLIESTVTTWPWLGGAIVTRTTGLPNNALAVAGLGLAPAAIPLASLLPQAGSGCVLGLSPDALALVQPSAGEVTTTFAVPELPALVGSALWQQLFVVELGPSGNLAQVSSGPTMAMVIGSLHN